MRLVVALIRIIQGNKGGPIGGNMSISTTKFVMLFHMFTQIWIFACFNTQTLILLSCQSNWFANIGQMAIFCLKVPKE